ncbi:MAG: hypothetical protein EB084_24150, partial [Proteobacteria bacterium]|nr:hypothetical protein [Pseudomonadota bacterium]
MSKSRQPEDLKRFKLELTKDGPRFVLSTGEQAAVAPETQERAPVPESPSEAPVSSAPAAEAAPVSAASDVAVDDAAPQAVADVPTASPVRPASPPKKGHARKLPPVK